MTTRLVVVGNGMVGHRLLEELATLRPPDLEITVLGEETRPAYDRVHLSEFFSGKTAAELSLVIRSFDLPTDMLSRLIEEHQFDLYNDPMPTIAALEGYVSDTASALFALAARIAAPPSSQIDHLARHAGLAQGFVQVVMALPHHAARRQLFLPQQVLDTHGARIDEVFAGTQTPKLRAAVDQLLDEARRHLGTALSLIENSPPEVRPVFLPLAVAKHDLARLSRADNDPFGPHVPSRLSTLWALWRASRSKAFS